VIGEHNAGQLGPFLDRCHALGIQRVVLRQIFGNPRPWELPAGLVPSRTYRQNPVCDYHGMEVTLWRFRQTTSTSINLFSDGTISSEYLLAQTHPAGARPERRQPAQHPSAAGTPRKGMAHPRATLR
jgi:hypothetical protein